MFFVDLSFSVLFNSIRKIIIVSEKFVKLENLVLTGLQSIIVSYPLLLLFFFMSDFKIELIYSISIVFFLNGIQFLFSDVLSKKNQYDKIFKYNTIANFIWSASIIYLSISGFELYSFIIAQIISSSIIILFCIKDFKYLFFNLNYKEIFDFHSSYNLVKKQSNIMYLLLNEISKMLSTKIDVLFISNSFGNFQLGIFNRASRVAKLPSTVLGDAIQKVVVTNFIESKKKQIPRKNIFLFLLITTIFCFIIKQYSYFFFDFIINDKSKINSIVSVFNILIFIFPLDLTNRLQNVKFNISQDFKTLLFIRGFLLIILILYFSSSFIYNINSIAYGLLIYKFLLFLITFLIQNFKNEKI
jgi:O-antigen/teichoic acid export membrane protein